MDLSRAAYSRDLKIAAMRALDAGSATGEIARKYQLSPTAGMLAWRVTRQRRTSVSGQWPARGRFAGAARFPPHRRVGAQNRPAHDGE